MVIGEQHADWRAYALPGGAKTAAPSPASAAIYRYRAQLLKCWNSHAWAPPVPLPGPHTPLPIYGRVKALMLSYPSPHEVRKHGPPATGARGYQHRLHIVPLIPPPCRQMEAPVVCILHLVVVVHLLLQHENQLSPCWAPKPPVTRCLATGQTFRLPFNENPTTLNYCE